MSQTSPLTIWMEFVFGVLLWSGWWLLGHILGAPFLNQSPPKSFWGKIHSITELNPFLVSHSQYVCHPPLHQYCSSDSHGCSPGPSFTNSWSTLKEPDWRGWVGSFRFSWSIRYTSDWGGTEAVGSLKHRTACEAVSGALCGMECARSHKTWISNNHYLQ